MRKDVVEAIEACDAINDGGLSDDAVLAQVEVWLGMASDDDSESLLLTEYIRGSP